MFIILFLIFLIWFINYTDKHHLNSGEPMSMQQFAFGSGGFWPEDEKDADNKETSEK